MHKSKTGRLVPEATHFCQAVVLASLFASRTRAPTEFNPSAIHFAQSPGGGAQNSRQGPVAFNHARGLNDKLILGADSVAINLGTRHRVVNLDWGSPLARDWPVRDLSGIITLLLLSSWPSPLPLPQSLSSQRTWGPLLRMVCLGSMLARAFVAFALACLGFAFAIACLCLRIAVSPLPF